jgi:predicted TIM-barrel fold metal-dependent hydrolase
MIQELTVGTMMSAAFHSPVPTQMVSNGEFVPLPQTTQQRKVEARIKELADAAASRLGMDRRQFLRTASGMATAFLAMNEVFGPVFKVNPAEAAEPEAAEALAKAVSNQFVFDGHLHMVRDDYPYQPLVDFARYAAAHWSPDVGKSVDDVPRAAEDWPSLNFVIYHSAMRAFIEDPSDELAEFERTGYIRWVTDLARIPDKHGVTNVYADTGTCFAISAVSSPRLCAAMMGTLIRGLGSDHVFWGTDSVWYGSPQWQIESFRRMEIPEDLQRKFGFAPLGPAEGPVKSGILGRNSARLYKLGADTSMEPWRRDHLGSMKKAYLESGPTPNNMAYGYVKSMTPTG